MNNPSVIKDHTLTRFEVMSKYHRRTKRAVEVIECGQLQFSQRLSEYLGTGLDPGTHIANQYLSTCLSGQNREGIACDVGPSAFALRCDNGSREITG